MENKFATIFHVQLKKETLEANILLFRLGGKGSFVFFPSARSGHFVFCEKIILTALQYFFTKTLHTETLHCQSHRIGSNKMFYKIK